MGVLRTGILRRGKFGSRHTEKKATEAGIGMIQVLSRRTKDCQQHHKLRQSWDIVSLRAFRGNQSVGAFISDF